MDALGKWMIIRYQTNTLPKWMFPKNICSDHPCCKMVSAAFKNVPQWPLPSLLSLSFFYTRLTASFRTVFRSLGRMLTFFDGLYSWKFFNVLGCDIMKHQCGSSSPKFKINTQLLNPLTPCTFLHEETVISSRLIKAKRDSVTRMTTPSKYSGWTTCKLAKTVSFREDILHKDQLLCKFKVNADAQFSHSQKLNCLLL